MTIFDPRSKFDTIARVLTQSRWFDPAWMSLKAAEGYPSLGAFGLRSGPVFAAYAFYHDLAHALIAVADNQAWRLERNAFGLVYTNEIELMGNIYYEPETDQAVTLELRVIALQYHLTFMDTVNDPCLERGTEEEFFKSQVSSLRYMGDFPCVKIKCLKEALAGMTFSSSAKEEKAVIDVLIDRCKALAQTWSGDEIQALWEKACVAGRSLTIQRMCV